MGDDAQLSAGRLLRNAREKQGLHVAALAASIKVPPKKLEALEADRYEELPDATFARALALTVCRALKIDAAPVLERLPRHAAHDRLEQVSQGLNTPFRDRQPSLAPGDRAAVLKRPALWLTGLVLVATLLVYLAPGDWFHLPGTHRAGSAGPSATAVRQTVTPAPDASAPAGAIAVEPGASAAATMETATASAVPAAASQGSLAGIGVAASGATAVAASTFGDAREGVLQFRVAETSWVEVVDARGASLLARLLVPGEAVGLDGTAPFQVRVGNASATEVSFRGRPTDLQPYTRDNVARLELK